MVFPASYGEKRVQYTMEAERQRVTGGEKKPGKQSLISANSSMPGLGNTHTNACAPRLAC